jgi:hypothetical protein
MRDVSTQVGSGCLARLQRRGCIARLRRRGCLACTSGMHGRLLSRPLRPCHPCGRRAGNFVTSADAAGGFRWLPWAQLSPCNSAWIQGLASQARGFRYLNEICISKGMRFRDAVWRMRFLGSVFGLRLSDAFFGIRVLDAFWVRFLDAFRDTFSDGIVVFVSWLCKLVWTVIIASINSSLYIIISFVAFKSHQFYIIRISSSYRVYIVRIVCNNCVRGATHEQL